MSSSGAVGSLLGAVSSVYYVAVRTIVLSRHGSNLARPVIIHDIIHGLIYMCQVLHIVDFLGSRLMVTAPTSIEVLLRPTQSQFPLLLPLGLHLFTLNR